MKPVIEGVRMIANTSANVLILGESGTGKEVLASLIHQKSSRKSGPYVPIDCASLPANLIESLLFGHEQGSFTDAQKTQVGKLELAHEGTLFLDEIGNIPLNIQAKLLRFIETREVERIGAKKPISVSVRLIAATNLDLKDAVKKGAFRADLYHRLNEFPITIPPLRERRDDIAMLARKLLHLACIESEIDLIELTPEALEILLQYEYPGNIRELKNMLKRAAILAQGDIKPEHLCLNLNSTAPTLMQHRFNVFVPQNAPLKDISRQALQTLEDQLIRKALEKTQWHYGKAAALLGITPRTLYNKMKELQIDITP